MIWRVYTQSIESKRPEPLGDYDVERAEWAIALARIEHQIPGCVCVGATRGEIPTEYKSSRLIDPHVRQTPREILESQQRIGVERMRAAKRERRAGR